MELILMLAPVYKVLFIYPAAQVAGVRSFIEEEIDPGQSENWIHLCLSASGSAPATHGLCEFHATKEQVNKWLDRFAASVGSAAPEGFVDLPRAVQTAWMTGAQAALLAATGAYFHSVWNDLGETITPAIKATALGAVGVTHLAIDEFEVIS